MAGRMEPFMRAVASTGSYRDRYGDEKRRYVPVGVLFKREDGSLVLKVDALPAGNEWDGFVNFYDLDDKEDRGGPRRDDDRGSRRDDRGTRGGRDDRGRDDRGDRRGGYGAASGRGGEDRPKENFARDLDDELPF